MVLRPDKQRSSSPLVTPPGTNDFSRARKIVTRLGPADRVSPLGFQDIFVEIFVTGYLKVGFLKICSRADR